MVQSYFESFDWNGKFTLATYRLHHHYVIIFTDDISEARLRALWVQHAPRSTEPKPQNGQSDESGNTEETTETPPHSNGDVSEPLPVDLYEGFDEEPFVQAAAQLHADNYHGILELLTEAIDRGIG